MARSSATSRTAQTRTAATHNALTKNPKNFIRVYSQISFGNNFDHTTDNFSVVEKFRWQAGAPFLFRKNVDGAVGANAQIVSAGTVTASIFLEAIHYLAAVGTKAQIRDRRWHSAAFTADRAGNATMYIDGVADSVYDMSALSETDITNAANFLINAYTGGVIDVCQFGHYSKCLTAAEVLAIHNGTDPTTISGCTAYYPMNEAEDSSMTTIYEYPTVETVNGVGNASTIKGTNTTCTYMSEAQTRIPADDTRLVRVGVFSDMHNTSTDETAHLTQAVTDWNATACDAIVGCGDIVAGASDASEATMDGYVDALVAVFDLANASTRRVVLGNHESDGDYTDALFIARINAGYVYFDPESTGEKYWSEDLNGVHLVFLCGRDQAEAYPTLDGAIGEDDTEITLSAVTSLVAPGFIYAGTEIITFTGIATKTLTGCTRGAYGTTKATHIDTLAVKNDGVYFRLSAAQLAWLDADLAATNLPTILFIHQRTEKDYPGIKGDGTYDFMSGLTPYSVYCVNSGELREVLEKYSHVKLVVSGHEHSEHIVKVNGIHYLNINALKDSHYGILDFYSNGEFQLQGFGGELNYSRR